MEAEINQLRAQAVPTGIYGVSTALIAGAKNAIMIDTEGREIVDFSGGMGTMNVGHSHPRVLSAAHAQVDRFAHTCFHIVGYEAFIRLAAKMNEKAPGPSPKRSYFVSSGAEAVENAVKVARLATGRPGIVVFENAFHGRTNLTLGLTSKLHYKKNCGPFTPEIYRIPYAYCYRCPLNLRYPACGVECAELLRRGFDNYFQADKIACVVVEPVQGEGGFIVPPPEYHSKLQAICEAEGILFVADEVQTGFGRTGKLFAMEHYGVEADIMTTAKSLGAGYPIGGITGKAEVMNAPHPGGIGCGTGGGNALACEVGLAVFEIMEQERLPERANEIGRRVKERFVAMPQRFPVIGDIRGLGAMMAIELVEDPDTKKPATDLTRAYRAKLTENGLANLQAGTYDNVIRTLMPLTIEWNTLDRGLDIMEDTLAQVTAA
jgi:4-aminobutyrate aminotransferase/(S)-3-amino-2-methylpropionate transaminase